MAESALTLKFRSVEAVLPNQIVDMDSFFNYYRHTITCSIGHSYHLNVRLQPVFSTPAGFEKNTGIFINTVVPESAASFLKK